MPGVLRRRVVIVGAGYSGVRAARDLARFRQPGLEIILINESSGTTETSSLYEIATAYFPQSDANILERLERSAAVPLVDIFAKLPVEIILDKVVQIDTDSRQLKLANNHFVSYDVLVVTVGAAMATHDILGAADFSFGIKLLPQAIALQRHISALFSTVHEKKLENIADALTFVVVGGGVAGVEIVSELTGFIRWNCDRYQIDQAKARVVLVESKEGILPGLPIDAQSYGKKQLESLGVEILCHQTAVEVTTDKLVLHPGETIRTKTIIWTAGLSANQLLVHSGLPLAGCGVAVLPTMQTMGHPEIFAAGQCASINGESVTQATVSSAIAQGELVAKNIVKQWRGETLLEFKEPMVGSVVAVGGKRALAVLFSGRTIKGRFPWMIKQLILLRYWLGYLSVQQAWHFWSRSELVKIQND